MLSPNEMGHTRLVSLAASSASAFIMAASLFAAALILNDIHSLHEEIMAGMEDFRVNNFGWEYPLIWVNNQKNKILKDQNC